MSDTRTLLPASVKVVFPTATDSVHVETVTLASLGLTDLGTLSFSGTKVLHSTARRAAGNAGEITALAQALARDWYRWQLGRLDLVLIGSVPWTLTGLEDELTVTQDAGSLATRINRGPFNDPTEQRFHLGDQGSEPPGTTPPGNLPTEEPDDPQAGDTWFNLIDNSINIFDGDTWHIYYPSGDCEPVSWTEYQSRCENIGGTDYMVRYKRAVTLNLVEGCLERITFSWVFDRKIASGVTCESEDEPLDCCPEGTSLAAELTLVVSGETGNCGPWPDPNIPLVFNGTEHRWEGETSGPTTVLLYCDEATGLFMLEWQGAYVGGPTAADASPAPTCEPVCLKWTGFALTGSCEGTVDLTIGCLAGPPITETCCGSTMPTTVAVTISSTGPCSGSGTLVYGPTVNWPVFFGNEPANAWQGSVSLGDSSMDFWLYCNPDTPTELKLGIADCYVFNGLAAGTCTGPLNLTVVFSNGSCCGVDTTNYEYTVTITEIP